MYECENWIIKKAEHWRIDAFELWCWRRLLRVPWTSRGSNQEINPKGNLPWIFIGRTDAKAEAPVLGLFDVKSQLIGKNLDAGKDWRQDEKGTTEVEMVGWHHQLDGHEFEQLWEVVKDREACRAAFHGAAKIQTWLSDSTTTTYFSVWDSSGNGYRCCQPQGKAQTFRSSYTQ